MQTLLYHNVSIQILKQKECYKKKDSSTGDCAHLYPERTLIRVVNLFEKKGSSSVSRSNESSCVPRKYIMSDSCIASQKNICIQTGTYFQSEAVSKGTKPQRVQYQSVLRKLEAVPSSGFLAQNLACVCTQRNKTDSQIEHVYVQAY